MSELVLRIINTDVIGSQQGNTLPTIQIDAAKANQYEMYNFHQNFMQPADEFTFRVAAERIHETTKAYLLNNAQVNLNMITDEGDNRLIFTGFIDQVETINNRESTTGTVIEIRGRSMLAVAIDDGIDPWSKTFEFHEGITLGQMMAKIFAQYGFETIYTSDIWARDIVTGVNKTNGLSTKTTTQTKVTLDTQDAVDEKYLAGPAKSQTIVTSTVTFWHDPTAPSDIEQLKEKKCKPQHDETAYHFAELHAKRFHLHIWGMPDGSGVVIGKPDFTQDPLFHFYNTYDGQKNKILESRLDLDACHMPAAIIAKGDTGGGDFANTTIKCVKVNEFLGYKPGAYQAFAAGGAYTVPQKTTTTSTKVIPVVPPTQLNQNFTNVTAGTAANIEGGVPIELKTTTTTTTTTAATSKFTQDYVKQSVLDRLNRFKNLPIVDPIPQLLLYQDSVRFFNKRDVKTAVVYWEDKTSKTLDQLKSAVQRRMSEFMRNAVRLHLRVKGHDQNGIVYRYNTICIVQDEKLELQNVPFWIEDVQFRRSRGEGTITELTLIPLFILSF